MAFKMNIRSFFLGIILSLILVTILSIMLSDFTNIPIISSGSSFLLIFVGVFISVVFLAAADKRIDKSEIWTLVLVAGLLTLSFIALKNFIPEIFSVLPERTQEAFGI